MQDLHAIELSSTLYALGKLTALEALKEEFEKECVASGFGLGGVDVEEVVWYIDAALLRADIATGSFTGTRYAKRVQALERVYREDVISPKTSPAQSKFEADKEEVMVEQGKLDILITEALVEQARLGSLVTEAFKEHEKLDKLLAEEQVYYENAVAAVEQRRKRKGISWIDWGFKTGMGGLKWYVATLLLCLLSSTRISTLR